MATRIEVNHDVADIGLADAGRLKIEWADRQMPVLAGDEVAGIGERREHAPVRLRGVGHGWLLPSKTR